MSNESRLKLFFKHSRVPVHEQLTGDKGCDGQMLALNLSISMLIIHFKLKYLRDMFILLLCLLQVLLVDITGRFFSACKATYVKEV